MSFRISTRARIAALAIFAAAPAFAQEKVDNATIERIKSEAMDRSKVMETMSWLTDVYGPRLTWSPNIQKAADWAMKEMKSWGLANVKLESWNTPEGLGWQNEKFSLMATAPNAFIVDAVPRAWSPGTKGTVTGKAVHVTGGCLDEVKERFGGKLKNAFVMISAANADPVNGFAATASRYEDSTLARMAAAEPAGAGGRGGRGGFGGRGGAAPQRSATCQKQFERDSAAAAAQAGGRGGRGGFGGFGGRGGVSATDVNVLRWFQTQGVAAVLLPDTRHTGGDIGTDNGSSRAADAPQVPAVHVAMESYGRLMRMAEKGVAVTLELNMQNTFYPANKASFNVLGEIPGTDPALKDEVVMIGAHFDSWHSGTGATDNAAGSAVMLEAMRIIKALDLKPRRTIRIALWTGEEQGLLGSRAYVNQHYGTTTDGVFHPTAEQEKFAGYFNVDNGSGKIRGVYLQGIEEERPIFDAWMGPFKSIGMKTLTISNTGGTDHLSYIGVGLPGFQFIQDPLDYGNVTHHTNQDVYERVQPEDMKFNSAVVAAFAWQAAQRDQKLPRPPQPGARVTP
jgi:hypothetical protein